MLKTFFLIIGIFAGAGIFYLFYPNMQSKAQLEKVRQLIYREIPIGSEKEEVLRFLTNQKIEHSQYLENEKLIRAILRKTASTFIVSESIELVFYFDRNDRLRDYALNKKLTGP